MVDGSKDNIAPHGQVGLGLVDEHADHCHSPSCDPEQVQETVLEKSYERECGDPRQQGEEVKKLPSTTCVDIVEELS